MKNLSNSYNQAKAYTASVKLPTGAYKLKIKAVKLEEGKEGKSGVLIFAFDICEGEFKDFFQQEFDANTNEDKKWKGTYRLYVPTEDGSDRDNWTMRRFKSVMTGFEEANNGFVWNWDESKLKGLTIGGVFGEREWEWNGRTGMKTECSYFCGLDYLAKAKIPAPKYLQKTSASTSEGFNTIPDDDADELPFG